MKELIRLMFSPDEAGGATTETPDPTPEPAEEPQPTEEPELKKWKYQLRKERQGNAFLDQFDSIDDLAMYAINKSEIAGIPGEEATDAERTEFLKALGVPETPEGYELEIDENVLIPEIGEFFRETFHEAELSQKQAEAVAAAYQNFIADRNQQLALQRAESFSELQKELRSKYGKDFPAKVEAFAAALAKFGGEDFKLLMKQNGLDNHPVIAQFLIKAGETLAEHPLHGVNSGEVPGGTQEGQVLTYSESFKRFAEG